MDRRSVGSILKRTLLAVVAALVSMAALAACAKTQTPTTAPATTRTTAATTTTTATRAVQTTTAAPTTAPATTAAGGVSPADFYKANVVTIVVPYGPGGSVDYASRLFANYWTEMTGGRMIVENRAGAGGVVGANQAWGAKPDGLTMAAALPGPGLITPTLAKDPAVKFDIKTIKWVSVIPDADRFGLVMSGKSTITTVDALRQAKGVKFAGSGRSSSASLGAGIFVELFGLQGARIVPGYGGGAEIYLAMGKGEVDAYITGNYNYPDPISKGFVKPTLVTVDFARDNLFPDALSVPELLKLTPEQENLLRTFRALRTGTGFWMHPNVPQDRAEFVRSTFDKIGTNENFVKQAKVVWTIWSPLTKGKDFGTEMEKTLAVATPERFTELQKLADKLMQ